MHLSDLLALAAKDAQDLAEYIGVEAGKVESLVNLAEWRESSLLAALKHVV